MRHSDLIRLQQDALTKRSTRDYLEATLAKATSRVTELTEQLATAEEASEDAEAKLDVHRATTATALRAVPL